MTFNVGELQATLGVDDSGVDSGLSGVLGKFQEFAGKGGAVMAAAGTAIGAGLAIAIAAAFEADTVTRKIQATLGASTQDSAKYGKAAGALFASNYGDSLGEVGDAVVSVVKNMQGLGDVSESVLVGITGQVISVAKTFDQDFNAVTRTAGQLMKTGLAKNATEAMDIITKGLQSPVNAADDLLDTFDEYSTIFRSLGLDGKDALGLLSQGLKSGARDADTVADSFKEMLLRIQGGDSKKAITDLGLNFEAAAQQMALGGEAAKTTTDLIIDALREVQDPAERSALALGVFGTKAEDMQAAIMGLDVSSAASQFEDAYGKIAGASADLDAVVGGSLQGAFEGVWRKMTTFASDGGAMLTPFLRTAAEAFGVLFSVMQGALGFISDIPGPLWAIGAAVAVWAAWGTIAGGVTALAGALTAAGIAARGFLASLGPIGILLAGATIAMAYLSDTSDGVEEALDAQKQRFTDLASTLDSATGAITNNTRAMVIQQAQATPIAGVLQQAGISMQLYADAALGGAEAQQELGDKIRAAQAAVVSGSGAFKGLGDVLTGAGLTAEELAAALDSGDWAGVTEKVATYADGVAASTGNTQAATDITAGFADAMNAAKDPVLTLGGAAILAADQASQLATAQADAAVKAEGFGVANGAAYAQVLAMATVGGKSADEIKRAGDAAGLSADQIESIQAAATNAVKGANPLAEALQSGASAASEMDAGIQQLQLALDTLAGKTISAEQATRAHEAVIRQVGQSTRDFAQAQVDAATAQAEADNVAAHLGQTLDGQAVSATNLAVTQEDVDAATRAAADASAAAADAADSQKDALDNLANSSQAMTQRSFEGAGGMANYDVAVAAATETMKVQRQKFIESAMAAGIGETAANDLANAQGLIPEDVATAYAAIRAEEARKAAEGVTTAANNVPDQKNITIDADGNATVVIDGISVKLANLDSYKQIVIETVNRNVAQAVYTGGKIGALVGGFAEGGKLPGQSPSNPHEDNLIAVGPSGMYGLRSGEWVVNEPASKYYGDAFMAAVNNRTFPKPNGYAEGGQVSAPAAASPSVTVVAGRKSVEFTGPVNVGSFTDAAALLNHAAYMGIG